MGMISSIRAPFPATEGPAQAAPELRAQGLTAVKGEAPVARPMLEQAVQHTARKPAANVPHLLEARMTAETSAAAAAEAAREAYIRASIAAGISPLPLPGR
jgi:hypothetical protein